MTRLIENNWVKDPLNTFLEFITSTEFKQTAFRQRQAKTISAESVVIYRAMFTRVLTFLNENHLNLITVQAPHIYQFLTLTKVKDEKPSRELILKSSIQYTYLRLLERVFTQMNRSPRPTDDLLFGPMRSQYKLSGRDKNTVVLSDAEISQFVDALPVPTAQERPARISANWKKRRDRALQCVLLGAGLTVAEVVALEIDEIETTTQMDGSLRINLRSSSSEADESKQPTFNAHTTFVQKQFVPTLLEWIKERHSLNIFFAEKFSHRTQFLFPGTDGSILNKATVYRQIRQTFGRTDLTVARMGGRTLRNTFASNEILQGTDVNEVMDKMGLFEDRSITIYTEAAAKLKIAGAV